MKPLMHPALADITVEGILHALSDPVRARILAGILGADCAQNCARFARLDDRTLPKSTLSQHFRVLREAGLIHSERKGVELQNRTRCDELRERFGPLVQTIMQSYGLIADNANPMPADSAAKEPAAG